MGGGGAFIYELFNDGDSILYIVGAFSYVNSQNTYQVLKWDGYNYFLLQNGIKTGVPKVVTRYKDKILFGGNFPEVNNIPNTHNLVAWNGNHWQAFRPAYPEIVSADVRAFKVYNDTLYMGGGFGHIGDEVYNKFAAFSNNTWINIGEWGGHWVSGLDFLNGNLYAGGYGMPAPDYSYAYHFCRYLGNGEWERFAEQPRGKVYSLLTDTINSFLYAGGGFYEVGDSVSSGVAVWDGFKWIYTGNYCRTVVWERALAIYRGDLFSGCGAYYDEEGNYRTYITRWNGETWDSIGGAFTDNISVLEVFRDTLYIGGGFYYWGGDSPIPTHPTKGLVKLFIPDNACDYLKPRINTWSDTFYIHNGEAEVNFYNNNPYADSWDWDFGDSQTDNVKNPVHIYTQPGEYNVQVIVTQDGCVKTANKTIFIELTSQVPEFEHILMQVYPNPSNQGFTVRTNLSSYQNSEIIIAGLNGHLQDKIPVKSETTHIPTKYWKPGVYVCNLFVEGKLIKTEKLVFE